MYEYISGEVSHIDEEYLVVDVQGVGYMIMADTFTLNRSKVGETATIYTYVRVGDSRSGDGITIYGFEQREQRSMFEKLISVSGVGPKAGISIMSALSPQDIASAIYSGDANPFTVAPGVGKKTAQRIILDLKGKIDMEDVLGSDAQLTDIAAGGDAVSDAVSALVGLGYQQVEAGKAVSAVKALGDTAEELVSLALKRMG